MHCFPQGTSGLPAVEGTNKCTDLTLSELFQCRVGNKYWYLWMTGIIASKILDSHSHFLIVISINTQVIIQNHVLSLARYLGLSADNHLDGQNDCQ